MYNSPTLKALAAQPIVNNDITTVEIPTHLQEEMNDLKELQQIQQEIKYCKRMYDLLQEILEQNDGDIDYYYETEDFTEGIEYFRDCEKWFKDAEYEVIGMINDKEDELAFVQNSLQLAVSIRPVRTCFADTSQVHNRAFFISDKVALVTLRAQ